MIYPYFAQEESVGQMRRRGPPQEDSGSAARNAGGADKVKWRQTETRDALERLKKAQCGRLHRPYYILGIDWSQYIDGEEVTGFGTRLALTLHTRLPARAVLYFCLPLRRFAHCVVWNP